MRRRRDSSRRPRPLLTFDERVEAAMKAVLPEEPVAYVFTPEEGRGFFRIRAMTESELGVKNEVLGKPTPKKPKGDKSIS